MSSPRQKKAGFLLPSPVDGWPLLDVCLKIPDAPEYRRAFVGHLYLLGLWNVWEKSYLPGDTRARDAALLWRETLNQYLDMGCDMGCCCNQFDTQYRWTADGVLQSSTDGGTTWTDDPQQDPRNSSPQFPPTAGDPSPDKKCTAATGAALLIREQVGDQLTDDMARFTLQQLIDTWTKTIIDTSNPFQALVQIAANQIFALGVAAVKAALTDDVWHTLACVLNCSMADDLSFDDAQWAEARTNILSDIPGIAGVFLEHIVFLAGKVGLTNLARSQATTGGDCSDCGCTPDTIYDFTIEAEPHASTMVINFGPAYGRYDAGQGWAAPYFAGFDQLDGEYTFVFNTTLSPINTHWEIESTVAGNSTFVFHSHATEIVVPGMNEFDIDLDGSPQTSFTITLLNDTHPGGLPAANIWLRKLILSF